jgi:hypothetical protein
VTSLSACHPHRRHYRYIVPRMVTTTWRYRFRIATRTGLALVLTSDAPWVRASRHLWAAGRYLAGA